MTIAFVAGKQDGVAYASASSYTTEASTTSTDRRLLLISTNTPAGTISTPSGWVLVGSAVTNANHPISLFSKVAGSVGTEAVTITISGGAARIASATFTDSAIGAAGAGQSGTGNPVNASTLTPSSSADMLIFSAAADQDSNWTAPSGETAITANNALRSFMAYELLSSGAATGTKAATTSTGAGWGAGLITLTPAGQTHQMVV